MTPSPIRTRWSAWRKARNLPSIPSISALPLAMAGRLTGFPRSCRAASRHVRDPLTCDEHTRGNACDPELPTRARGTLTRMKRLILPVLGGLALAIAGCGGELSLGGGAQEPPVYEAHPAPPDPIEVAAKPCK